MSWLTRLHRDARVDGTVSAAVAWANGDAPSCSSHRFIVDQARPAPRPLSARLMPPIRGPRPADAASRCATPAWPTRPGNGRLATFRRSSAASRCSCQSTCRETTFAAAGLEASLVHVSNRLPARECVALRRDRAWQHGASSARSRARCRRASRPWGCGRSYLRGDSDAGGCVRHSQQGLHFDQEGRRRSRP